MKFLQWLLKLPLALKRKWQHWFAFLHDFKSSRWLFWPVVLIPTIASLVLVIILPLFHFKRELNRTQPGVIHQFLPAHQNSPELSEFAGLSSQLLQLKLEELFLNSQLIMAKSDSIGLLVNLADSTISLYLRGVNLRSCPISCYTISHAFKHLKSKPEIFHWLSRPFLLKAHWATVPKVPITVRKAPRDTIEAQKYKFEPAAPARPDVLFSLQFDRNLLVTVRQIEPISFRGLPRIGLYYLESYARRIADTFVQLYHLKLPEHRYSIEIAIPKNDAIAIYRALPMRTELVPRLPIDH